MAEFNEKLLYGTHSCRPCTEGEHDGCRKHPDRDGSFWYDDPDHPDASSYGKRLFIKDKQGNEIPRPPCVCMKFGHPVGDLCRIRKKGDNFSQGSICGKPAKGAVTKIGSYTYDDDVKRVEVTVPACGTHMAAKKRRDDNDAKREAKSQALKEKWAREKSSAKASEDWAQKLSDEFGLPTTPLQRSDERILIEMSPEVAYKKLAEIRDLLTDVYGDDHPWSRS